MKQNNLIKNLSQKAATGLIFGVIATAGIAMALAFTEPTSWPTFGEPADTDDKGDWLAYGRGWVPSPSASSSGIIALTKDVCDDATSTWQWFEDGNGDGDYIDEEDGICVRATTTISINWGGTETLDNTYIADYSCSGNFPNGTSTVTDCALCVADCYDGRRDLPLRGGYDAVTGVDGHNGPITPEVLKNWKGTRLPTTNDFFGFCGAEDGDTNDAVGDSTYYSSGASASTTIGLLGGNVGRGTSSEYMYLSNSSYEWLSEQHDNNDARVAGGNACSYFYNDDVGNGYRFRAVFRP